MESIRLWAGLFILLAMFLISVHNGYVSDKNATGSLWIVMLLVVCLGFGFGAGVRGLVDIFSK